MIKANELRLGNYIKSGINGAYDEKGIIGKVLEIGNEERDFEQIYCECDESFEWFFKGNYFGIKLTEEWLLKFGLEKIGIWTFSLNLVGNLDLIYYLGEKGWSIGLKSYSDFSNLKYVHQLQNLYFALTGEELIIKK